MRPSRESRDLSGRLTFWLVVCSVLVGAALRLYQLAHLPISTGFDPAYYGLDALAILDGHFPVYLPTNFGREVLFSYIVAAVFAAIGVSDFGIHLSSAFIAVLTIPMTYAVAGELFRFQRSRALRLWAPVLASAVLAVSYWHIVWSRFGVRAILAPFFVSLTMFLLLRALRTNNRRLLVLAGLAAGAGLYTYQIGQLLPLLILATVILDWRRRRDKVRPVPYLKSLLWLAVPYAAVAFPLVRYAAQHPTEFNQRVRDVAVVGEPASLSGQAGVLAERLVLLLRFFTIEGDLNAMWSVGRLPGLNVAFLVAFVIGLLVVLRSWRRFPAQVGTAWLVIMLAPAVLAGSGPISKRALGALPAIAIAIALGFLSIALYLRSRSPNDRLWRTAALFIIGGSLLFALARSYTEYFVIWANDNAKDGAFDAHISEMGTYIASLPEQTQIYLSADAPNHPNMLLHSLLRTASGNVHGYNGWRCFVYPEFTGQATTYVLSDDYSVERLQDAYPAGVLQTEGLSNVYGHGDYYVAYHIEPGETAVTAPQHTVQEAWSDKIALLGYDLQAEVIAPGENIDLALYWRALQEMDMRYTSFVHLEGEQNPATGSPIWGQYDSEPCQGYYPTSVWRGGEIIRDQVKIMVAPDAPPGRYKLVVGFYTWPDIQGLPASNGDSFTLQEIVIEGT